MASCLQCGKVTYSPLGVCSDCANTGDFDYTLKSPPTPPQKETQLAPPRGEVMGAIMVALPVVAGLLVWFWVDRLPLVDQPASKLGFIGAATVVITGLLAAVESARLGFGIPSASTAYERVSPVNWFFSVVLLWIIYYPIYLHMRRRKGARSLVGWGILSMTIFIAASTVVGLRVADMQSRYDDKLQEFQDATRRAKSW